MFFGANDVQLGRKQIVVEKDKPVSPLMGTEVVVVKAYLVFVY